MPRSIAEKRKEFMTTLLGVMNRLDPTGANADIYEEKFGKMSDEEFVKWITEFKNDEKQNLYLETIEYERDLTLPRIKAAANFIHIPLYERVAVPHINQDPNNVVVTPEPIPVGFIHIKRMPQTIHHKNAGSTDIKRRNSKTGQVTGEDKNGRNTDVESYALTAYGASQTLAEFMGPRADDLVAKNQMYAKIERDGVVYKADLHSHQKDKVAINTLNTYYWAMGFTTNIVNGGNLLPSPEK